MNLSTYTFQEIVSGQQWAVTSTSEALASKELGKALELPQNAFTLVSTKVLSTVSF
jgi:hypothetical protein